MSLSTKRVKYDDHAGLPVTGSLRSTAAVQLICSSSRERGLPSSSVSVSSTNSVVPLAPPTYADVSVSAKVSPAGSSGVGPGDPGGPVGPGSPSGPSGP